MLCNFTITIVFYSFTFYDCINVGFPDNFHEAKSAKKKNCFLAI